MFRPGVNYLDVIAAYCKKALRRRDRLDFPDGAAPIPKNYECWNITRGNLMIRFDPYQVTAYAFGPQDCRIPLIRLRHLLADPDRWRPSGAGATGRRYVAASRKR